MSDHQSSVGVKRLLFFHLHPAPSTPDEQPIPDANARSAAAQPADPEQQSSRLYRGL